MGCRRFFTRKQVEILKNILILNAGTRDVLIQDFIETVQGRCEIVVTDNFELAPAIYESSKHYVTKRWNEEEYWEQIDNIIETENIGLIISLIDPELSFLARQRKKYEEKGVLVCIGSEKVVDNSFDKFQTMEFLRIHGFNYIKSYIDVELAIEALKNNEIQFPLITKPRNGSGSAGIEIINSVEKLNLICRGHDDILIQEFVNGQEIGADVFVDLISKEVVSIFTKKKIKMRAGETDKSVSFKDKKLFDLIERFSLEFGLYGVNDIDIFERAGEYYISEVNPRFGGGYIHAYANGVNFPKMLINNMNGITNLKSIGEYDEDVYMMKYFSIKVLRKDELINEL